MNKAIIKPQELSHEIIEKIEEIQEQIASYKRSEVRESLYGVGYFKSSIEELEQRQLELSGFRSVEKMHKAIGRFYNGELELDSDWWIRYKQDLPEEEMHRLRGRYAHDLISMIGWWAHGGDWLEQMYHMRRLVELLESRPYGQGLYEHKPEEKDEKKSDESPELKNIYHISGLDGMDRMVDYHVNIASMQLFNVMKIYEDAGYVVRQVIPRHIKRAAYFSEDFRSVREVHWSSFLEIVVEVRANRRYKKDEGQVLHI